MGAKLLTGGEKSCEVKLLNIKILNSSNHFHCTLSMPDGTKIATTFVYAPKKDDKVFWEDVLNTLKDSVAPHHLFIGDCNVTLDQMRDWIGYITDPQCN